MDSQHAKFLLHSFRAGGKDEQDPHFAEALRQAEQDAELRAWLAAEQALDDAIRRKLREAPVPEGLREAILARRDLVQVLPETRSRAWLALAAAIVFLLAASAVWWNFQRAPAGFASYRDSMVASLNASFSLDFKHEQLAEVQRWLAARKDFPAHVIPAGLQSHRSIGCRTLSWGGRPVGLICFLMPGDQVVHLFIVPKAALPDAPAETQPVTSTLDSWTTVSWTRGETVYVMASHQPSAVLEKLL